MNKVIFAIFAVNAVCGGGQHGSDRIDIYGSAPEIFSGKEGPRRDPYRATASPRGMHDRSARPPMALGRPQLSWRYVLCILFVILFDYDNTTAARWQAELSCTGETPLFSWSYFCHTPPGENLPLRQQIYRLHPIPWHSNRISSTLYRSTKTSLRCVWSYLITISTE